MLSFEGLDFYFQDLVTQWLHGIKNERCKQKGLHA